MDAGAANSGDSNGDSNGVATITPATSSCLDCVAPGGNSGVTSFSQCEYCADECVCAVHNWLCIEDLYAHVRHCVNNIWLATDKSLRPREGFFFWLHMIVMVVARRQTPLKGTSQRSFEHLAATKIHETVDFARASFILHPNSAEINNAIILQLRMALMYEWMAKYEPSVAALVFKLHKQEKEKDEDQHDWWASPGPLIHNPYIPIPDDCQIIFG